MRKGAMFLDWWPTNEPPLSPLGVIDFIFFTRLVIVVEM